MALEKVIETDGASIAIWQIEESIEELNTMLDGSIVEKITEKYSNEKRIREQLISHILIKDLLGESKEITHLPNGAPQIEGEDKFISISHSRKSIAVAISDKPIGIDIEEIDRKQYKLHKRFTTSNEQKWIEANSTPYQKQLISAIIWSTKEAIYKLANIEGLLFESEIEITPFSPTEPNQAIQFNATYRNTPCKCQLSVVSYQLLVISFDK